MRNKLGMELRRLRRLKGDSLRTVESETGISNAYLSQLERGVAANPTFKKLRTLAEYFGVSYTELLDHAGYLGSEVGNDHQVLIAGVRQKSVNDSPLFSSFSDLTDGEEDLVLQYIEFLKSRRSSKN